LGDTAVLTGCPRYCGEGRDPEAARDEEEGPGDRVEPLLGEREAATAYRAVKLMVRIQP